MIVSVDINVSVSFIFYATNLHLVLHLILIGDQKGSRKCSLLCYMTVQFFILIDSFSVLKHFFKNFVGFFLLPINSATHEGAIPKSTVN